MTNSLPKFTPWPHQVEAVDKLRRMISLGRKRICCVAPCGAGKSLIAALILIAAMMKSKAALIIAPQIELVDQMAYKFMNDYGLDCGIIMANRPYEREKPIQICSIQTLLARQLFPPADFIILDEAHLFSSDQRQDFLFHYFNKPVIGLTATPIGKNGVGLDGYDEIILAARYDELRKTGILVPAIIFKPNSADMRGVDTVRGDWDQDQAAARMEPLIGDIHKHWMQFAQGCRTLLFAASVAHSRFICEQVFLRNGIQAAHIYGNMDPLTQRNPLYKRFREGELKVICTCNVLSEGTDFPELECIINASPTQSLRRWRQRMGRVLRSHPGKTRGIIIDHTDSGSTLGYPDEDVDWELGNPNHQIERMTRPRGNLERPWLTCPKCKAQFYSAPACPYCGFRPERSRLSTQPEIRDGQLEFFERGSGTKSKISEDQKIWNTCLGIAAHRNNNFKSAMAIFKTKTGRWPSKYLKKMPPEGDARKMLVAKVYPGFVRKKRASV